MKGSSSGKDFSWAEMLEIRVVRLTEICNCSQTGDKRLRSDSYSLCRGAKRSH